MVLNVLIKKMKTLIYATPAVKGIKVKTTIYIFFLHKRYDFVSTNDDFLYELYFKLGYPVGGNVSSHWAHDVAAILNQRQ